MKITKVRLGRISVPLRVPFKTALRQVNSVEDIIVEIHTDTGEVGYGEAPPTGAITGDTTGAIIGAFQDHIIKTLVGRDVEDFENLTRDVQKCIVKTAAPKRLRTLLCGTCTARNTESPCTGCWGPAGTRLSPT